MLDPREIRKAHREQGQVSARAAFHSLYASYRQFANTVAANYEGNVKQRNFYARNENIRPPRAMYLAGNEIPEKVYDNLIGVRP